MKKNCILLFAFSVLFYGCNTGFQEAKSSQFYFPLLKTNNTELDSVGSAFHIAMGDVFSNIRVRHNSKPGEEKPLLFAGFNYTGAWTRDAAINVWNGGGLLFPDVSKNTLEEVLIKEEGTTLIGGQYWDNLIWTLGAWNLYLCSGDKSFLKKAYYACVNTIKKRENEEFDSTFNLFRGPAVYGDGVAAYDDRYTETGDFTGGLWVSNIDKWAEANPALIKTKGVGMPMMCLSTNAMYHQAYNTLSLMEKALGFPTNTHWQEMSFKVKKGINSHLWNEGKQTYNYYIDPWGTNTYQEGLGLSFVLLFDIADSTRSQKVLNNVFISNAGIPCVWPSFPRYFNDKAQSYGRHSGTVWGFIQGFWVEAAAKHNRYDLALFDFNKLTQFAIRDKQFREIYHPSSTLPYGGLQEAGMRKDSIHLWESTYRQTWTATAYIRTIFNCLFGMKFEETGIRFSPKSITCFPNLRIIDMPYRGAKLSIYVTGKGSKLDKMLVNNTVCQNHFLSLDQAKGKVKIELVMKNN